MGIIMDKVKQVVDKVVHPKDHSTTSTTHGTTSTTHGSGLSGSHNAGPHSSSTANRMDPKVDSDMDGSRNMGAANYGPGGHSTTTGMTGSHNTAGPHSSDMQIAQIRASTAIWTVLATWVPPLTVLVLPTQPRALMALLGTVAAPHMALPTQDRTNQTF